MELALTITNLVLAAIMAGIFGVWVYFVTYMTKSFRQSPIFEIIAINDSSTDRTGQIIKAYAANDLRVIHVDALPKPEGWTGKNWACHQGYLGARGELLMFTDADSKHLPSTMSLAVGHLLSQNLEALTAVPRLICNDFWTKMTLPVLATFSHTRFSP